MNAKAALLALEKRQHWVLQAVGSLLPRLASLDL